MAMASKSEVNYSRGHAGAHCGKAPDDDKAYCRYFIPPLLTAIRRAYAGCTPGAAIHSKAASSWIKSGGYRQVNS
jgi:hypothetical protein